MSNPICRRARRRIGALIRFKWCSPRQASGYSCEGWKDLIAPQKHKLPWRIALPYFCSIKFSIPDSWINNTLILFINTLMQRRALNDFLSIFQMQLLFCRERNDMAVSISQGQYLDVWGLFPWLWDFRRASKSSVKPVYLWLVSFKLFRT